MIQRHIEINRVIEMCNKIVYLKKKYEIYLLHSASVLNNPVLYIDCLMLTFSFDPKFAQYPNAIVAIIYPLCNHLSDGIFNKFNL